MSVYFDKNKLEQIRHTISLTGGIIQPPCKRVQIQSVFNIIYISLKSGLKKVYKQNRQNTKQPCLQGRCLLAYKGVKISNSLISKNVSKMYLGKMSNLNDLWSKNVVKYYVICHLLIREFCMMELRYK
ncbi:Hypothetical_protein [Hexamita inflata]|uniref:Hypothetical_protein n=1 Tax=Hexamita inflata TaxID=28002 RepID=A0AA86UD74_9EUKA|nr:Hypothetical protein HINF_LOCUS41175 [Hexamita inflata]